MNTEAIITTEDGVDIEVEKLNPGDYIEPTSIEAIFGVKRTEPQYGLKTLSLAKLIERKSVASGRPLQCKGEGYGVRIMTASEQVEYNWDGFLAGIRRIDKSDEWMKRIDASGLSGEVAKLKTDRQQKIAGIRQALEAPRKRLSLSFSEDEEPKQLETHDDSSEF